MCLQDWNELACRLLEDHGDEVSRQGFPSWFEVFEPGHVCRPAGETAGTLGWLATPECVAAGLVATARIHVLSGPDDRPDGMIAARSAEVKPSARLACVVARDGAIGWQMAVSGAETPPGPPEEGRMLDCLRRGLGLSTPPPDHSAKPLQALFWLGAILSHARKLGTRLTWTQVLALHPMVLICGDKSVPPDIGDRIASGGMDLSWEKLRLAAVEHNWAFAIVEPAEAAWMDEGMFSRWVLSELPAADPLLERVRPLVTPSASRRLSHSVRAAYSSSPKGEG